jgi:hypothetical protein
VQRINRAQQLQEPVVEQQHALGQGQFRRGAGGKGGEHGQRQLGVDAFLAREVGGEACGLRIVGGGRTIAGEQLRLALERPGSPELGAASVLIALTAGVAPAEPDVQPGAQRLHDGAGAAFSLSTFSMSASSPDR